MKGPARYFDHNASAPARPEVCEAVCEALAVTAGNPSSMHSEGRRSAALLDDARRRIAAVAGVTSSRIVFTSGATEANNLALRGALEHRPGLRLISSTIEHASILATLDDLAAHGADVVIVEVDADGRPDYEALARAASERFSLVSLGWANGESGHVADVGAILRAVSPAAMVHLDAAQMFGRLPIRMQQEGVDMISLSAHKIGGPTGIGVLIAPEGEEIEACITGGPHEGGRRAGTENVPAVLGMSVAVSLAAEQVESEALRLRTMREELWNTLSARIPGLHRISPPDGLPNTLTLAVADATSDVLIAGLDLEGYCVSSGSACAAASPERSHVMEALGLDPAYRDGVVRISMGWSSQESEIAGLAAAFERVLDRVRVGR